MGRRTPTSTYRLQITADFTLFAAAAAVPYLRELGVGAVYVSPLLQATSGSMHGYDVVDHARVDVSRGGEAGLAALAAACRSAGLGLVVDIVPNHMGVSEAQENGAWWDLLTYGQSSPRAGWFDVDWAAGNGRILIPVLGDDAQLSRDLTVVDGELRYFEHRYPLAPGSYRDGDDPADVHARQHYELVSFRRADTDQNYRRFFAVTTLAGLRVEDDAVFDATHAEILRWVSAYGVTGIRIDHPDGLADPGGYLARLVAVAPDSWITVEKITEPGEDLPASWPVAGMTGYDALAEVNGVLIDPITEASMTGLYTDLTGDEREWEQHVADGKRLIATTILQAEMRRMARLVPDVEGADVAFAELAIAFGVYRSYLPLGAEHLYQAVETASSRRPEVAGAIEALLPRLTEPSDEVCMRFQQTTGAVMAKGVEDTAYYRFNRLIALNEVGGYPGTFGLGVADFHASQQRRVDVAPSGMTTLSTHDTKRGEDVRARIAVLPELADEWEVVVRRLAEWAPVPNPAFGYLLWQTVVATGLIERGRLHAFAEKAMREAADGTGWIDPESDFEDAVHAAVDAVYDDGAVRATVTEFADRLNSYGRSNSLTAKLVQLTMPGVPDVYQGTELWEDSLVDPDNRRPVDLETRSEMLNVLVSKGEPPPVDESGAAKLWIVTHALRARRDRPELFSGYTPLLVDGPLADCVIAFDRGGAITVATRLPVAVEYSGWTDTDLELSVGNYRDALTGARHHGTVLLADLLETYPVALLLKDEPVTDGDSP
ncbi:MAG TPA: malto-oligosyltrehalose synthase [Jatrophihabitans sp.]|jgi:(1->4)-alpha-D-glucan 1-alpha-D-glucosylmutase